MGQCVPRQRVASLKPSERTRSCYAGAPRRPPKHVSASPQLHRSTSRDDEQRSASPTVAFDDKDDDFSAARFAPREHVATAAADADSPSPYRFLDEPQANELEEKATESSTDSTPGDGASGGVHFNGVVHRTGRTAGSSLSLAVPDDDYNSDSVSPSAASPQLHRSTTHDYDGEQSAENKRRGRSMTALMGAGSRRQPHVRLEAEEN